MPLPFGLTAAKILSAVKTSAAAVAITAGVSWGVSRLFGREEVVEETDDVLRIPSSFTPRPFIGAGPTPGTPLYGLREINPEKLPTKVSPNPLETSTRSTTRPVRWFDERYHILYHLSTDQIEGITSIDLDGVTVGLVPEVGVPYSALVPPVGSQYNGLVSVRLHAGQDSAWGDDFQDQSRVNLARGQSVGFGEDWYNADHSFAVVRVDVNEDSPILSERPQIGFNIRGVRMPDLSYYDPNDDAGPFPRRRWTTNAVSALYYYCCALKKKYGGLERDVEEFDLNALVKGYIRASDYFDNRPLYGEDTERQYNAGEIYPHWSKRYEFNGYLPIERGRDEVLDDLYRSVFGGFYPHMGRLKLVVGENRDRTGRSERFGGRYGDEVPRLTDNDFIEQYTEQVQVDHEEYFNAVRVTLPRSQPHNYQEITFEVEDKPSISRDGFKKVQEVTLNGITDPTQATRIGKQILNNRRVQYTVQGLVAGEQWLRIEPESPVVFSSSQREPSGDIDCVVKRKTINKDGTVLLTIKAEDDDQYLDWTGDLPELTGLGAGPLKTEDITVGVPERVVDYRSRIPIISARLDVRLPHHYDFIQVDFQEVGGDDRAITEEKTRSGTRNYQLHIPNLSFDTEYRYRVRAGHFGAVGGKRIYSRYAPNQNYTGWVSGSEVLDIPYSEDLFVATGTFIYGDYYQTDPVETPADVFEKGSWSNENREPPSPRKMGIELSYPNIENWGVEETDQVNNALVLNRLDNTGGDIWDFVHKNSKMRTVVDNAVTHNFFDSFEGTLIRRRWQDTDFNEYVDIHVLDRIDWEYTTLNNEDAFYKCLRLYSKERLFANYEDRPALVQDRGLLNLYIDFSFGVDHRKLNELSGSYNLYLATETKEEPLVPFTLVTNNQIRYAYQDVLSETTPAPALPTSGWTDSLNNGWTLMSSDDKSAVDILLGVFTTLDRRWWSLQHYNDVTGQGGPWKKAFKIEIDDENEGIPGLIGGDGTQGEFINAFRDSYITEATVTELTGKEPYPTVGEWSRFKPTLTNQKPNLWEIPVYAFYHAGDILGIVSATNWFFRFSRIPKLIDRKKDAPSVIRDMEDEFYPDGAVGNLLTGLSSPDPVTGHKYRWVSALRVLFPGVVIDETKTYTVAIRNGELVLIEQTGVTIRRANAPTGLRVSSLGPERINASWTKSTTAGASTEWRVTEGSTPDSTLEVSGTAEQSVSLRDISAGVKYFHVRGVAPNHDPSVWVSSRGINVSAVVPTPPDIPQVASPKNVSAATPAYNEITGSWSASSTLGVEYEWLVTEGSSPTSSVVAESQTAVSGLSVTVQNVSAGLRYFHVRGVRAGYLPSDWESSGGVSVENAVQSVSLPTNLRVSSPGANQVRGRWTRSSTASASSEWRITETSDPEVDILASGSSGAARPDIRRSGITAGVRYFHVRGVRSGYTPSGWVTGDGVVVVDPVPVPQPTQQVEEPTGLRVGVVRFNQIEIQWRRSTTAGASTDWRVTTGRNPETSTVLVSGNSVGENPSFGQSGITAGVRYVHIRGVRAGWLPSDWVTSNAVTVQNAPVTTAPPSHVDASSPRENVIQASWEASTSTGSVYYEWRITSSVGALTDVVRSGIQSETDVEQVNLPGGEYWFHVRAGKSGETLSGWVSDPNAVVVQNEVRDWILGATDAGIESVDLGWSGGLGNGQFVIEKKELDGDWEEAVTGLAETVRRSTVGELQPFTQYQFRLKQGSGGWSNVVTYTTRKRITISAVILEATGTESDSVTLGWRDPGAPAGTTYTVKWKVEGGSYTTASTSVTGLSYTVENLRADTAYVFEVARTVPNNAPVAEVSARTRRERVGAPGNLRVSSPVNRRLQVAWSASATSGARYRIEYATSESFSGAIRPASTYSLSWIGRNVEPETYWVRVKAVKSGLEDSDWVEAGPVSVGGQSEPTDGGGV